MEEVDDDVADLWEVAIETWGGGILAQGILEDGAKDVGDISQVGGLDPDGIEGPTREIEFIAQAHVDIGDVGFGGRFSRPLSEGFQQLLGGHQQVCHALFDLRDLFIGLQRGLATLSSPASPGMLTTLLADWERPEADELRPEVEAMATPGRGGGRSGGKSSWNEVGPR